MKPNVFMPRHVLFKNASTIISYGIPINDMPEGRSYWKFMYACFLTHCQKLQGRRPQDLLAKDLKLFAHAKAMTEAPFSASALHDAYYKLLGINPDSLEEVNIMQDAVVEARALSKKEEERDFFEEFLARRLPVYREVIAKRLAEKRNKKAAGAKPARRDSLNYTTTAATLGANLYNYVAAVPELQVRWERIRAVVPPVYGDEIRPVYGDEIRAVDPLPYIPPDAFELDH